MTDSLSELALFKGTSPDECEAFVSTVRLRALEQGKHRDNESMAVFASGHLRGEALYWYEDLEESVQNNWSQLRPALLARFGARVQTSNSTSSAHVIPGSTSSTTIPTPAAAPPTTAPSSLVRKGRVKVLSSSGALQGYIKKSGDGQGSHNHLTISPSDALLVSFTPSADGLFAIQINDASKSPQTNDALAITWRGLTRGAWRRKPNYLANCCSLSAIRKSWEVEHKVWAISEDGELSVEYPTPDGGSEKLQPQRYGDGDTFWWARQSGNTMSNVRIVFEDAI